MNYEFPHITNIADVLPAIEGRDEFVVAKKEGYTVINYNVMMADTFPDVETDFDEFSSSVDPNIAKIRRECRGISFDTETGDIIRRPFFKFFNINEREETQLHNLDFSKEHWVDTKLDGSMCSPMVVDDEILWATKMAAPDFHDLVSAFVDKSDVFYKDFVLDCVNAGHTPIFEYMSRKKRIVIDYPEDALVLLAVRDMVTGQYIDLDKTPAKQYGVPIVEQHSKVTDPKAFMEYVHDLKNAEGFVIRWADGHRVKIKAHEYVQIHKAKEAILQDRNIVELILDEKLDDIKAHLPAEDRDRLTQFESNIHFDIARRVRLIGMKLEYLRERGIDRKTFAIDPKHSVGVDAFMRPIIFKNFDNDIISGLRIGEDVRNTIRNNLGRTAKYEAIRDVWFPGLTYND
jgi:RNA ligase